MRTRHRGHGDEAELGDKGRKKPTEEKTTVGYNTRTVRRVGRLTGEEAKGGKCSRGTATTRETR